MTMLKYAVALCMAMGLVPAHAQYREGDEVFLYAEVGNGEGGTEGLGYHRDQSIVLSKPKQMLRGTGFTYGEMGTQVRVKARAGSFPSLSAAASTWGSGPIALSRAYSDDTVVAGAPGLAPGEPIVYTARFRLSATTSVSPVGFRSNTAQFSAGLTLGRRTAPGFSVSGNETAERELIVKYTARAGEKMDVYASVQAFTGVTNVPAPVEPAAATAQLNAPARVVLSADKPGANITGRSGYVYE